MKKPSLVVVEFTDHQAETLVAALTIAQFDFELHVMAPESLIRLIPSSIPLKSKTVLTLVRKGSKRKSIWQAFQATRKIDPDFVLLNDPQGNTVKWFCLLGLLLRAQFVGIHQNPDKFYYGSSTQSLINLKMKKYFVLANYILKNLEGKIPRDLRLAPMYAVYWEHGLTPRTEPDRLNLVVHGFVEMDRRDYLGLLQTLRESPVKLSPMVVFHILGNAGKKEGLEYQKKVAESGLTEHFRFYQAFVPQRELIEKTAMCDGILTLLHPGDKYYHLYKSFKVSGAYLWSGIFAKPLLLEESFAADDEFRDWGVFYRKERLVEKLNQMAADKSELQRISSCLETDPRFSLENQRRIFRDFLLNESSIRPRLENPRGRKTETSRGMT